MSWYSSNFADRIPVAIVADEDETSLLTISPAWDQFWSSVMSTGYDVQFFEPDGITPMQFERVTWNVSTKTGTFRLLPASDDADVLNAWMYYGYASATDQSVSTPATMVPGVAYIYLGTPSNPVDLVPDAPGATSASTRLAVTTTESRYVWFRLPLSALPRRDRPHQGSEKLDEPFGVSVSSYAADGTTTSTTLTVDATWPRLYEAPGGDWLVGLVVRANGAGTPTSGDVAVVQIVVLIETAEFGQRGNITKRFVFDIVNPGN